MEAKKILLMLIIAGLFLTVLILFPMVLLNNKSDSKSAVASVRPEVSIPDKPFSYDVRDTLTNDTASPAPNSVIINNNVTPLISSQPTDQPIQIQPNQQPNQDQQQSVTQPVQDVPKVTPTQINAPTENTAPKTNTPAKKNTPAENTVPKTNTPAQTTPKTAPKVTSTVNTAPKTNTPAKITTVYDYWIQTGSYSTQSFADNAKKTLAGKGISSVIEKVEVNGANRFRVYAGPYISQSEADYWIELIKVMDGLSGSFILQTPHK
jgi:cell division protein FtsN